MRDTCIHTMSGPSLACLRYDVRSFSLLSITTYARKSQLLLAGSAADDCMHAMVSKYISTVVPIYCWISIVGSPLKNIIHYYETSHVETKK